MTTIANDVYSSLGLGGAAKPAAGKNADALGQADFLRLMTEQLKHQDPLNPMENSAFLGQLAQFSTVQGIQNLNASVAGFSSAMASDQLLRGATMVGREVLLPASKVALPVRKGQRLGEVQVLDRGAVLARSPLVAANAVERPGVAGRVAFYAGRTLDHLGGLFS